VKEICASTEELAGIHHQQMRDRQDDHKHEKAVVGLLAQSWMANSAARYAPAALPNASGIPTAQSTSLASPKTSKLCRPTTSRTKAFRAFPCRRSQPARKTNAASRKKPEPRTTSPA